VASTNFFNPSVGIVEDPATRSTAGPLACYLATYGHITSEAQVMIEQGYAQERPDHIEVHIFGAG
jgi:trans-2,3-dihydro-3-hydroxyanthranilate isomerase